MRQTGCVRRRSGGPLHAPGTVRLKTAIADQLGAVGRRFRGRRGRAAQRHRDGLGLAVIPGDRGRCGRFQHPYAIGDFKGERHWLTYQAAAGTAVRHRLYLHGIPRFPILHEGLTLAARRATDGGGNRHVARRRNLIRYCQFTIYKRRRRAQRQIRRMANASWFQAGDSLVKRRYTLES